MVELSGIQIAPRPQVSRSLVTRVMSAFAFAGPPDIVSARRARQDHNVTGKGIVVAVLDSGCRASHAGFSVSPDDARSRVLPGRNFTGDGNDGDTEDRTGHGTAVAGLVAARSIAPVVSPGARILPLRIFSGPAHSDFSFMLDALSWLLNEGAGQGARVVCLSMGDVGNWPSAAAVPSDGGGIRQKIAAKIRELRDSGATVIAAVGNSYFVSGTTAEVGMCFPAIMPHCISVGAAFNGAMPARVFSQYGGAATMDTSKAGQIAPFSQRLPESPGNVHFTRLFAPGAPLQSLSKDSDTAKTDHLFGTSIAVPIVAGVVALMQEWHNAHRHRFATAEEVERWLLAGADGIRDDAGTLDNVVNTDADFRLVNAAGAMRAMIASV